MAMEGGDNTNHCTGNPPRTVLDRHFSKSDDGSYDNAEVSCSAVSNTTNIANLQVCHHGKTGLAGQPGGNRSGRGAEGSRAGRGCGGHDCGGHGQLGRDSSRQIGRSNYLVAELDHLLKLKVVADSLPISGVEWDVVADNHF